MTDPLFGSVSPPLWPAIPAPVYGYAPSPLASSHRFGTIGPGSSAQGLASAGPFSAGPTLNGPAVDPHGFGGLEQDEIAVPLAGVGGSEPPIRGKPGRLRQRLERDRRPRGCGDRDGRQ